MYTYLIDDGYGDKKAQGTKKCIIKHEMWLKFVKNLSKIMKKDHTTCLRVKYREKVHKNALSSKDDKRLQTLGEIMLYPYGTISEKVCKTELIKIKHKKWWI